MFRLFTALILIATLPACSSFGGNVQQQLVEVNQLHQSDPQLASEQMKEIKQQHGDNAEVWVTSGFLALKEKQTARAKVAFNKALQLDSYSARATLGLALCADNNREHDKAQGLYRQALKLNDKSTKEQANRLNINIQNNLAMSYLLSQKPKLALQQLENIRPLITPLAQAKQTSHEKVWFNLALAHAVNRQEQQARRILLVLLGATAAEQQLEQFAAINSQG